MQRIGLVVVVVVGLASGVWAQGPGVTAVGVSGPGQVTATVGTFPFAPGDVLALEIVREAPCPWLCDELLVVGFEVRDAEGTVVYADEAGPYPASAAEWLGRWDLLTRTGGAASEGRYTALVLTSVGEFRAELDVSAGAPGRGRALARATVCGIGFGVYRLVDETDEAATVALRVGERLMIALPGNPTTGYGWEVTNEPPFLAPVEGVAYRPESTLIGAGGTFYFRYEATATGEGELSFAYRRPWEVLPPEQTFSLTVIVR